MSHLLKGSTHEQQDHWEESEDCRQGPDSLQGYQPKGHKRSDQHCNEPRQNDGDEGHQQVPRGEDKIVEGVLPYASELFGVYQPLIGWRSKLQHERISSAITSRFNHALTMVDQLPKARSDVPRIMRDPTGTLFGKSLVTKAQAEGSSIAHLIANHGQNETSDKPRSKSAKKKATEGSRAEDSQGVEREEDDENEAASVALLKEMAKVAPAAINVMFEPKMTLLNRALLGANLFASAKQKNPRDAYLSPIGLLHLFREYFFEVGTFLGPPVGHVWISAGSSLELIESNTRRVVTERTMEQSAETSSKAETSTTDKTELAEAVKDENTNDLKLGISASGGGGIGVFHASGSMNFNLSQSRKEAREQTHKKMREQSSKLTSEVRQNFKTTFRTVSEITDTTSRRYVLKNDTNKLVNYELRRKMRKVAVQVQDLGKRLCWQLFVDTPGDRLGTCEFVHATAEALETKSLDLKPVPTNQNVTFNAFVTFNKEQGRDNGATNTYTTSPNDANKGIFDPKPGPMNIIQFKFTYSVPPAPNGYKFKTVQSIDFHGASVRYDQNLEIDPPNQRFSIRLTFANFNGAKTMPFDAILVYEPTEEILKVIRDERATATADYNAQQQAAKDKIFTDALRTRLKNLQEVIKRPSDDMREEERSLILARIIETLYGKATASWSPDDFHLMSEVIRYLFDVDAMLYFVAPDWWKPQTREHYAPILSQGQAAASPITTGTTAYSQRAELASRGQPFFPGHGKPPVYLVTEESAPVPVGTSLGWKMQLDGDKHRNAFLNTPWVKAVLPIRPGREKEAIEFLERPEVAHTDGLDEDYGADDPSKYSGKKLRWVLLDIAREIKEEYERSLEPVAVDDATVSSKLALPTEKVFSRGYDPLENGIRVGSKGEPFGDGEFQVFSEWLEILPTDQVVATEYVPQ
jgi:hypothetical protein